MINSSFLRSMPWMDKPAHNLENLFVTYGTKHVYKKDSVFKDANVKNENLYYLLSGFCYTFTTGERGEVNISRLLTKGSVFGEVTSVLRGAHSLTHTKAVSCSTVYSLKYEKLLDLITCDKELVNAVIEMYAWRVGAYHISVYVKNTFSNEQKLALLFMSMYDNSPVDSFFTLPFSFTHQQIGELVGLARETVSRLLSRWREKEYIRTEKNTISILPSKLQDILKSLEI